MDLVRKPISGRLYTTRSSFTLRLDAIDPGSESMNLMYLHFAYTRRGEGDLIFPSLVLDDWGTEIKTFDLYRWIEENGDYFPRAELFGFDEQARETQVFIRELELVNLLPCFILDKPETSLLDACRVSTILVPTIGLSEPKMVSNPPEFEYPLSKAAVDWWLITDSYPESQQDVAGFLENPNSSSTSS